MSKIQKSLSLDSDLIKLLDGEAEMRRTSASAVVNEMLLARYNPKPKPKGGRRRQPPVPA